MQSSETKNLRMVDLHRQHARIAHEVQEAIDAVMTSAAFINGPAVKEFAASLQEYTHAAHVIPCGNGTDALQIAMMGLNLKPGDEILVPAFTYVATAEVIALLGLKPVFVDVEADTFNIDLKDAARKISDRTRAVVPVHLFGQCAHMAPLMELAEQHSLHVIEDTAQSLGAEYHYENGNTAKAGSIGSVGITSFFPSKNLGCYGDGGALLTNDAALAKRLKSIGNHGQSKKYHHDRVGVNSRLDSIQAAILNVKIRYLDDYCARRREAAALYDAMLEDVPQVKTPYRAAYSTHVFNQYTIRLSPEHRDGLRDFLKERGIPSMLYYPMPLHMQKAYSTYGYRENDFPVAEGLTRQVLSLPMHTELEKEEISFITDQLKEFFHG